MTIIQSPQQVAFAANLLDYVIDSDKSLSFDVKKGTQLILSENYAPDGNWIIRTHKIGLCCGEGLWGVWPTEQVTHQTHIADTFNFEIDGTLNASSFIIASRGKVSQPVKNATALTVLKRKVTRLGCFEYLNVLVDTDEQIHVAATDDEGVVHDVALYTHVGERGIVTIDVSLSRVMKLVQKRILKYNVGGLDFIVDSTRYLMLHQFRYMNNFDLPETATATGDWTVRGSQKSEYAFHMGIERRFTVSVTDEYTVNSGVILSQSDYIMWHELITSRKVQMWVEDHWVDIVVTKCKYDRNFKKNVLKSVEFTFRLAEPSEYLVL